MNAARKNLLTAGITLALCIVLIVIIAVLSVNPSRDIVRKRPSTFFSDRTGSRAVLLVFEQLSFESIQWRRPLTDLEIPSNSAARSLIVFGPANPLSEAEADILDEWISSGGQLILAADTDWPVQRYGDDSLQSFLARHGLQSRGDVKGAAAVNASVLKTVGKGRILYVPDPYAFSNGTLRGTDNSVWLVERCNEWSRVVLFDEYHHGFGEKRGLLLLTGMFLVSPWGFAGLQLALAGLIYVFGYKRRFGKPAEETPIERTSPIETVQALAGLFQSAEADVLAVRSMHQHLNTQISSVLGRHIDLSDERAREQVAHRVASGRAGLESYVREVDKAMSGERITDIQMVDIARAAATIGRSFSHGVGRNEYAVIDREPQDGAGARR